ncbi:prolyl endopeptidase-like [Leptonychotes weddellii]|uniref:Prolyl endopeptidase-like n=1 Tax=Leptonychotes weddellii TaxID=9713 RepID=A0A2U3XZL9_LEPWE|nr:prolyl endopeptidase-like [Leptonychotes weddellii]
MPGSVLTHTRFSAFVEAQNKITVPFLEQCPIRGLYKERMTELYDYPKYSCHFKKGKRYFYFYNTGLQNQRVLYVQDSLEGEARVFLDPNILSDDGTVALRGYAFSEDGEYFAYGLSASGSDWVTIKFMKVDGARELPDVLERVKFSCMAWTHDGKGMFYNSYPQQDGKSDGTETSTNLHQKLCYHVLGTDQSEDILCAEFPDEPKWMGGAESVITCGKTLKGFVALGEAVLSDPGTGLAVLSRALPAPGTRQTTAATAYAAVQWQAGRLRVNIGSSQVCQRSSGNQIATPP